jgi:phospholipase C
VHEPPAGASNPIQAAGWDAGSGNTNADSGAGEDSGADAGAPPQKPWTHAPYECFADTDHSWKGQHWAWDNGLNDGFYAENNGSTDPGDIVPDAGSLLDGERAMWWYDQTDLPFDYQLANTFAIADNYFCSILGPTGPNRQYLVAATSFGLTDNSIPGNISQNVVDNVVVPDELEQRHVTWATYTDGTPSLSVVLNIGVATRYPERIRFAFQDFLNAAQKGTLPQVSWVDPKVGLADGTVGNNDDHPPADVQIGSQFLSQVYQAVTTSPQWAHTALFITWDENGGEYDHVPPSASCAPDAIPPQLNGSDKGIPGDFTRYGFRVPLIVVSPYARKGYVSHNVYDHTSIARFIEAKFKIPALTARDANADALMDLFDFTDPPSFSTPPSIPAPGVDDAGLQTCTQLFGQ